MLSARSWRAKVRLDRVSTDLDRLAAPLSSDDSPEECMLLSDLDGFLTGVICSPAVIMPSEWLPVALGGSPAETPYNVNELIMERYDEIVGAKEGHVIAID